MKYFLTAFIVFFNSMFLSSQNFVSQELAGHVALNCLFSKTPAEKIHMANIFQIKDIQTIAQGSLPVYHVVTFDPEGYVIVAAQKTYHPVIAFSWNGNFDFPVKAPAVNMWLDNEAKKIVRSAKLNVKHNMITEAWEKYESTDFLLSQKNNERLLQPMLTTQWNQGMYYNEMCPADPAGPDGKTYAGCVATAIGQVMNYFKYPKTGTGSYTSEYTVYGTHTVNYSNAVYNWNQMPLKLLRSNHPVAELLYHIGVSVDMNYGPNGSGMWNHKAAHTMKTFFSYTDSTQYNFRDTTTIDWNGMLIDHLDRGIVLYYAGWADSQYVSGHAFVCDGYQDSTFFHFNWGWGGAYDGFFNIDNLIVGGADFTTMHEAVINATPAINYPYYCSGTDTLTSLDGTIEDGSGPIYDYLNNSVCSWLIMPHDTISSISLNFVKCDLQAGDVIKIYNGSHAGAPLLGTYTGSGTTNQINSTGKTMFVKFESDGSGTSGGFLLSYKANQVKTCSGLTTVTAPSGTITDGSGQYNYQSGNFCRWRIEPPGAELIILSFSEFDIDSTDYVRITDLSTNAVLATLKGSQLPPLFSINTDKVQVMFFSNATGNAGGFMLHYDSFQQSIDEMMASGIKVYPNPASESITISIPDYISLTSPVLNLYTLSGQKVGMLETENELKEIQFNVSDLPPGFYILNITDFNGHSLNKKVVISR
jgi:hypothetical protein